MNIKKWMLNRMPDVLYLKLLWHRIMGGRLNLRNPVTFNEKLQWLKLYDHNPFYTILVDKYAVRQYIAEKIGEEYLITLYGVWERFEDIDFSKLPDQFVLKCTHDSGSVVICRDKQKFDVEQVRIIINRYLKRNYYYRGREWCYKNVKPRIMAEQYLEEEFNSDTGIAKDIIDYKLMCFHGKVKCSFVCTNRNTVAGLNVNFYDSDWKEMPFERSYPRNPVSIEKPTRYEDMVSLAEILTRDIPFGRVDFYQVKERIYFGEITLYPGSGLEKFTPESYDSYVGKWLNLETMKSK